LKLRRIYLLFKPIGLLLIISAAAILVHGYHPYVEDAEIYVPGIKQKLNPTLYPYNSEFFASHARLTFFPNLIAESVRIAHLPAEWTLLLWHFFSIFLLLLACWHVGRLCFDNSEAHWGGVALVASLLTIPVAGTALYIMDQYLNTRSLSTPCVLFIVSSTLERKVLRASLWTVFTALIHPLMVVFGLTYALLLWLGRRPRESHSGFAKALALLPLGLFPSATDTYRQVMESHSYFFLSRWEWYEWLGIFAPLALLWWFRRIAIKQELPVLDLMCRGLIWFGGFYFALAMVITVVPSVINLAKLQPMRSMHMHYVLFFIFAGGLLAKFVLRDRVWMWLLLFVPLCVGMFYAQRQLFPATAHIEWPNSGSSNDWVGAFEWVRDNTPVDAYFALNPDYMELPGADQHGFRAIAERSRLADRIKDSGVVTMFPRLAETWKQQVEAQNGWKSLEAADFRRLQKQFGVNWIVLEQPGLPDLNCPYKNKRLVVCSIR